MREGKGVVYSAFGRLYGVWVYIETPTLAICLSQRSTNSQNVFSFNVIEWRWAAMGGDNARTRTRGNLALIIIS